MMTPLRLSSHYGTALRTLLAFVGLERLVVTVGSAEEKRRRQFGAQIPYGADRTDRLFARMMAACHNLLPVKSGGSLDQCFRFPGIGPAAESNPATIRIKYEINLSKPVRLSLVADSGLLIETT